MQGRILECLKKAGKPLGRTQIALLLKEDPIVVSLRLRQLVKYKDVKCVELNKDQARKRFGENYKRPMRLYYI